MHNNLTLHIESIRGALVKFELGGLCITQKNYYFVLDVLQLFQSLCCHLFLPTPHHQCRVKKVASPPKKLQMGPFDIFKHLGSLALFDSLAILFQETYSEISSGVAPPTFVHAVSFGCVAKSEQI